MERTREKIPKAREILSLTPTLEFSHVKAVLEEKAGKVPDELLYAVAETGSGRDLRRVARALGKILSESGEKNGDMEAFRDTRICRIFVARPKEFVKIAEIAKGGTSDAFALLGTTEIVRKLVYSEKEFFSSLGKFAETSEKYRSSAFLALSRKPVSKAFAKDPESIIRGFAEISKLPKIEEESIRGCICDGGCARLFAEDPIGTVRLLSRTYNAAENGKKSLYKLRRLEEGIFTRKNMEAIAEIVEAAGTGAEDVLSSMYVYKGYVAEQFEKNPGIFVYAARILREDSGAAFNMVAHLVSLGKSNKEAKKIISALGKLKEYAGGYFKKVLWGMGGSRLGMAFVEDNAKIMGAFGSIRKHSGEGVFAAFANPFCAEHFAKNTGLFVEIAKEMGADAAHAFIAVSKEDILREMGDPEKKKEIIEAFRKIRDVGGEAAKRFFWVLGSMRVTEEFIAQPHEVSEVFLEALKHGGDGEWEIQINWGGFAEHMAGCIKICEKCADPFSAAAAMNSLDAATGGGRQFLELSGALAEVCRNSGEAAEKAIINIGDYELWDAFLENSELFVKATKAAGEASDVAIGLISVERTGKGWKCEPGEITGAIERICRLIDGKAREAKEEYVSENEFMGDPHLREKADEAERESAVNEKKRMLNLIARAEGATGFFWGKFDDALEIAEYVGIGAGGATDVLEKANTGKFYEITAENPETIINLAKACGRNTLEVMEILERNGEVLTAFREHPGEVTAIARAAAGKETGDVLGILNKEEFLKAFMEEPGKMAKLVVDVCRIMGRRKGVFFMEMTQEAAWKLFAGDLGKIREIAEAPIYANVLGHLVSCNMGEADIGKLENLRRFVRRQRRRSLKVIVEFEEGYRERWMEGWKLAREAGVGIEDREVFMNFAYGADLIGKGKVIALYREFGIEYFARYSKKELEGTYSLVGNSGRTGKPVLVIGNNKLDWNGAFYGDAKRREGFIKKGYYDAFIFEAETEREFYAMLFKIRKMGGRISTGILGGHGEEGQITLGPGGEEATLDLTDYRELERLKEVFVENPVIVLNSCSTGKDEDAMGALMSRTWNATLSAPRVPAAIWRYIVSKPGEVLGATYDEKNNVFRGGKVEAGGE